MYSAITLQKLERVLSGENSMYLLALILFIEQNWKLAIYKR